MTLPQFKQFGAVAKSGWIEALQSHLRRSVDNLGLVESSSAAIAEVRSAMLEVVVEAPLSRPTFGVAVPDCGCDCDVCVGFLPCLARTLGRSEINLPEAEEGDSGLALPVVAGEGSLDRPGDGVCNPP